MKLDGDGMFVVKLPGVVITNSSVAQGDKVGLITVSGEILTWTVGGALKQLSVSKLQVPVPESFRNFEMKLFFHPDDADTVFVVLLSCCEGNAQQNVCGYVQWTVQKYSKGSLSRVFETKFPVKGLDHRVVERFKDTLSLKPRKIDNNGVYSIGVVGDHFLAEFNDLGCKHNDHWMMCMYVTFDTYQEVLSHTDFFHYPSGIPRLEDQREPDVFHTWCGHMFLPIVSNYGVRLIFEEILWDTPTQNVLVSAIRSCDQISSVPPSVTYIGNYLGKKFVWEREDISGGLGLDYCWVINAQDTGENFHIEDAGTWREIQGDGTFVVLFREHEYIVWSYDKACMSWNKLKE